MKRFILIGAFAAAAAMFGGTTGTVGSAQAAGGGGQFCNNRICSSTFRCSIVATGKRCLVQWTLVNGVLTRTGCSVNNC